MSQSESIGALYNHYCSIWDIDPDFHHDYLVTIRGDEFGGGHAHACVWGLQTHIDHHPQGDESVNQRLQDSIDEAHSQGALFTLNHPFSTMPSPVYWRFPIAAIIIWGS